MESGLKRILTGTPEKVKKNRSKGLQTFIENTTHDLKAHLSHKDQSYWNNMSSAQRQALHTLSTDKTIVIKQADKGGALVIMKRSDYEKECLSQLSNKKFYEDLPSDPKMTYRKAINETVDKMHHAKLVTDFESEKNEGRKSYALFLWPAKTP